MAKCDEALGVYNMLLLDGMAVDVEKDCEKRRDLYLVFRVLFMAWAAVSGQAALCLILHFDLTGLCAYLFMLALAGMFMLLALFLWIAALTLRMNANRLKCVEINRKLRDAFDVVKRDCPEARWPKELTQFRCDC